MDYLAGRQFIISFYNIMLGVLYFELFTFINHIYYWFYFINRYYLYEKVYKSVLLYKLVCVCVCVCVWWGLSLCVFVCMRACAARVCVCLWIWALLYHPYAYVSVCFIPYALLLPYAWQWLDADIRQTQTIWQVFLTSAKHIFCFTEKEYQTVFSGVFHSVIWIYLSRTNKKKSLFCPVLARCLARISIKQFIGTWTHNVDLFRISPDIE